MNSPLKRNFCPSLHIEIQFKHFSFGGAWNNFFYSDRNDDLDDHRTTTTTTKSLLRIGFRAQNSAGGSQSRVVGSLKWSHAPKGKKQSKAAKKISFFVLMKNILDADFPTFVIFSDKIKGGTKIPSLNRACTWIIHVSVCSCTAMAVKPNRAISPASR